MRFTTNYRDPRLPTVIDGHQGIVDWLRAAFYFKVEVDPTFSGPKSIDIACGSLDYLGIKEAIIGGMGPIAASPNIKIEMSLPPWGRVRLRHIDVLDSVETRQPPVYVFTETEEQPFAIFRHAFEPEG